MQRDLLENYHDHMSYYGRSKGKYESETEKSTEYFMCLAICV